MKMVWILLLCASFGGCATDAKYTTVINIKLPAEVRGETLPDVGMTFTVVQ